MKNALLIMALSGLSWTASAQQQAPATLPIAGPRNLVKLNITAPLLKNYGIQVERILNKRLSVALTGRVMPAATIPLKTWVQKEVVREDNQLVSDILDQVDFSNYALTPELRYYFGKKGYGQGFYLGPYYKFARYNMHTKTLAYEVEGDQQYDITVSGALRAHTGGIAVGAQWHLTRHLSLDLWLLGPAIGGASGALTGVVAQQLSAEEQEALRSHLQDIDIPFSEETVTVHANGGGLALKGTWAGVKTGVLIAWRF